MPNERLIYFGDTAHLPYGDKSADAIKFYSLQITKLLLEKSCKLIVIACNSASAVTHRVLPDFFKDTHFINVIDPLVKKVDNNNYSKVGVIATKMTIGSNIYRDKLKALNPNLLVEQLATPLLIPMIEEGFYNDNISQSVISTYLSNERFENMEALLLACTHFPLIKTEIADFFDNRIDVLDSTDIIADAVYDNLYQRDLLSEKLEGNHEFLVSDFTNSFEETAKLFYNGIIDLKEAGIW